MKMKKSLKVILYVFVAAVLVVGISAAICTFSIKTAEYNVPLDGIEVPARVVCISDLHSKKYGTDNARLIEKIAGQNPDAIFVVGDMVNYNANEDDVQDMLDLLTKLNGIAQVYFSLGNHEKQYIEQTGDDLLSHVAETGVIPLNDSYTETQIGENSVRVGGTLGHAYPFGRSWEEFHASDEYVFLKEFEDTELPTLCLAHLPDTIIFNKAYMYWNTDLFVSGHTHGGVVRIPGVGGLYAPMQGWLPEYDYGKFELRDGVQMVITSGLSGYDWIPRLFNRPEICAITLVNT